LLPVESMKSSLTSRRRDQRRLCVLFVLLAACANTTEPECKPLTEESLDQVEDGCGFVRFTYRGDAGDSWGRTYAADSGKVVQIWNRVDFNNGCAIGAVAGEEPACSDWQPGTCNAK
jgi:hypothetical protein